ncbi:MAG: ATP-binding protein, partial [Candidatus Methanoperedenaceae archaeon]|nr:ATP-binding protein [Candidatus Methanoperedenaceae archaeon]
SIMLEKIKLQNFKLHKDTTLEIKPITIFIGQNNSGKSSIFQALQLIKQNLKTRTRRDITWDRYGQSISGQLIPPKSELERSDKIKFDQNIPKQPYLEYYLNPDLLIDIGTYNDVLRKDGKFIGISLYGNVITEKRTLKEAGIENIQIQYEMKFRNNALNHHHGEIRGGQFQLDWDWSEGREESNIPIFLKIDGINFSLQAQNVISEPIRSTGSSSKPNIPYESQANAEELKDSIVYSIKDIIGSIHAIYGLRGFEETSYPLSDTPPSDTDFMLLHDRSRAINSLLPYNRELESQLSSWFKKLLGVEISFELLPGKTVKIKAKNAYGETSFINEGLGIHQLLFMFLPIAMSPPSHTFLIEEPEAHLHPKAQSDITSTFIKILKSESKQFLIATHSEHILFGFLNALAKKEISLDDIVIYYFKNEKGVSEITKLNIDEYGRVAGGLPGFFEQNIRNVIDYLDAIDSKNEV